MKQKESRDLDWATVARRFLASPSNPGGAVAEVAERLTESEPEQITAAVNPLRSIQERRGATRLLLMAIKDAVEDHALSEVEMRQLVHMQRVLRLDEGDLVEHHPEDVGHLLRSELARVLEDFEIDPEEALHKVRLQEVLGLGYDDFLSLTAPEIERVIVDLLHFLNAESEADPEGPHVRRFHETLRTLNTLYRLNVPSGVPGPRSGYLYLLVNPAMPGLVKLGRTGRAPADRVAELTSATGVPRPFLLVYELFVQDAHQAEAWVHAALERRGKRPTASREFFSATPSEAVELMMAARDRFGR